MRTVASLVLAIGATAGVAAARGRVGPETATAAIGGSAALGANAAIHAARGRISPVYFLDALAEAALIGAWVYALRRDRAA